MRSSLWLLTTATACALTAPDPAPAQAPAMPGATPSDTVPCARSRHTAPADLAGVYADYLRTAELAGAVRLRPRLRRRPSEERRFAACGDGRPNPWLARFRPDSSADGVRLRMVPPRWVARINSAYPADVNDGALWAGRGVSTGLDGGVHAVWRRGRVRVSATVAPRVIFHENRDFELVTTVRAGGYSPYIYPWHPRTIDWPQRFGDARFWTLDPGQTQLRVDAYGWTLGVSNENLWWGPAQRYPLLLSNTAPGFPHVFLGTSRPLATPVGHVDGRLIWGRLSESDYFDARSDNDRRLFAGVVFDYEPRWLPGLFLGFARAFLATIPPDGLPLAEYLRRPYARPRSNGTFDGGPAGDDQLFSVFGRWAFPAVGFEAYAEWAREDHWEDLDDLLMEPDHSQAYMLGFQKVVRGDGRWIRLYGELAHLGSAATFRSGRPPVTFYTHHRIGQGYTHRGQLLGAAIGPGSDAQLLGADVFAGWGRLGLYVERVRRDNDAYYARWARYYGYRGHDLELTAGVRHHFFDGDFHIGWGLAYSTRRNRSFIGLDGSNFDLRTEQNWTLDLEVRWLPRPERTAPQPAVSATGTGGR